MLRVLVICVLLCGCMGGVAAVGGSSSHGSIQLYDDDPDCFDLNVTTFANADPDDIVFDDELLSLVGFDVVLGESGCFETIVYHFYRDDFWDDQCTVFVFHPEYTGLCGEPATQRILVRSHVGNRPK